MQRPSFQVKVSKYKSNDRRWRKRKDGQVRGETCSYATITEELVRKIRSMKKPGVGAIKIRRMLQREGIEVSFYAITGVISGNTWRHVT